MTLKEQLRQRLRESQQAVLDAAARVDAAAAQAPVNPDWSVHDLVAHLASAEIGHMAVIRRLATGQSTVIPGFDLDSFNNAEVAARRQLSWAELLAEYQANRAATLAMLEEMTEADWAKAGPHPGGFDATIEGVFRVIAIHERRHLRELKAALEKH